jgi:hypothetical protein
MRKNLVRVVYTLASEYQGNVGIGTEERQVDYTEVGRGFSGAGGNLRPLFMG